MDDFQKEKNFISVVVYLHNNEKQVQDFFQNVQGEFDRIFENYEFIVVDDACSDGSVQKLKEWAKELEKPLTILHMGLYHCREDAMSAGIDQAIGDFIYEFNSMQTPYDMKLIMEAYQSILAGNDIVCVCPSHVRRSSNLFYKVFNANSNANYKLQTDVFRVVTRRAINRVHASNSYILYRKAAYVASGLRISSIMFDGRVLNDEKAKLSFAIDSLALYTNAGYRVSIGITLLMMLVAFSELIYTIIIYCVGKPVAGWTTTMMVMSFGFLGLFFILSIAIKFMSLNLDMIFRKQKYLIESIEKL